jgi:dihydrolipoyl dehydrogenase
VLVVEMLDRLVPGMDRDLATGLHKTLARQGMKFRLRTTVEHSEAAEGGMRVALDSNGDRDEAPADVVLVAVGRRPYTDGLGLDELGVRRDERGRIAVDPHYRTNVEGIFAIGDVIAGPMLAHKAQEEGIAAVELMSGHAGHVNYAAVPSVVYTWPEAAGVGMSEEDAVQRGIEVRVGSFPFLANGRAHCMGETDGFVKIIADAASDRILGVHILGPDASDLIAEAAVAIEFAASAEDLARSVHAHPTLAEAVKEAALGVAGRSIHV